jgi:hypothetical protein
MPAPLPAKTNRTMARATFALSFAFAILAIHMHSWIAEYWM